MGLRAGRVLAVGLGTIAALGLLEGGAQVAASAGRVPRVAELRSALEAIATGRPLLDASLAGPGQLTNNLVLHPYLGFAIDPDLAREDGFPNGPVGELGFLGADPLAAAPPGSARVAVLGGSFASQLCVRAGDALRAALAPHASIRNRPISLDCLAIGSARQPQQLMTLSWLASLGVRYDLVLVVDGFNDIVVPLTYNYRKRIFRSFPQGWDQRAAGLPDRETLLAIGRVAGLDDRRQQLAAMVRDSAAAGSAAVLVGWRALDRSLERRRAAAALALDQGSPEREKWERQSDRWAVTGPRIEPASESEARILAVADWAASSRALAALAEGLGGAYVHALQPNQYLAGSQPLLPPSEAAKILDPNHFYAPAASVGYPMLIEAGRQLQAEGITFLDLTDVFRETRDQVYSDACCHLTTPGYALVAAGIGRRLEGEKERE